MIVIQKTAQFIEYIGRSTRQILTTDISQVLQFTYNILSRALTLRFYVSQIPRLILEVIFMSLTVIFLTSFFIGAVLTLQTSFALGFLATPGKIAIIVMSSVTKEIGPVLTGIIIAGRISSSIAAEISTMKNSDQINALTTLSINPYSFLIIPRIVVGMIFMPVLLIVSNICAVLGSTVIATTTLKYASLQFMMGLISSFSYENFMVGIVKAFVFGFIITYFGALKGMHASNGSGGVGQATTGAVVASSIFIIFANYLISISAF